MRQALELPGTSVAGASSVPAEVLTNSAAADSSSGWFMPKLALLGGALDWGMSGLHFRTGQHHRKTVRALWGIPLTREFMKPNLVRAPEHGLAIHHLFRIPRREESGHGFLRLCQTSGKGLPTAGQTPARPGPRAR